MTPSRLKLIFLAATLLLSFNYLYAAEETLKNVGFLPSNIWYSKDPFFAGDKIRVYTVIFNGSDSDLEGQVEFYDNNVSIGKTDFSLAGGGRIRDIWINWTATNGNHTISAKIVNPKISAPGEEPRSIIIANAETGTNERVIDFDINKNGVADSKEIVKNAIATGESVILNKVGEITNKVTEILPIKPAIETAKEKVSVVDEFREAQEKKVKTAVAEVKKDLGNIREAESAAQDDASAKKKPISESIKNQNIKDDKSAELNKAVAEKPLKYVYLFFLSILEYILKVKLLFYGLLSLAVFWVGRFAYRRIFG